MRLDPPTAVHEVLDRVGYLELAARGGPYRARRVVDRGREHVDADEREVARRLCGLLREPQHPRGLAGRGARQLRNAVVLRIGDRCEQDERLRLVLAKRFDELDYPALEEVVAEVHHERILAEERLRGEHRVREAQGLVLEDVGEAHAEARPVSGGVADLLPGLGRDDHSDLLDPGGGDRFDPVEEHGLVRDRHELLRARVRYRPQPRPLPAREDQPFERLHWTVSLLAPATRAAPLARAACGLRGGGNGPHLCERVEHR